MAMLVATGAMLENLAIAMHICMTKIHMFYEAVKHNRKRGFKKFGN